MEEKAATHPFRNNDNSFNENGKPITDYKTKYELSTDVLEKMQSKFQYTVKDWAAPNTAAEKEFVLDQIIGQLLEAKKGKWGKPVQLEQKAIKFIIDEAAKVFMTEKLLLDLEAPVKVIGDVHGQFFDLFRIFDVAGFPSTSQKFLFIGDYVDRGKQSIETIILLLSFKIKYPDRFFMLRGNHECQSINRMYGFYDECKRRYNLKTYREFELVFNVLPISAIIDDRILCMHGGLSPDLIDLESINHQPRPFEVPDEGIMCDLVWSDPEIEVQGWASSDRGVSFVFGQDIVKKFNKKHQLNLICRAHQVVEDGYEFMANRGIVTIFSAPNYCGEFDNNAGILNVDETLCCSFDILKPVERKTLVKLQKEGNRTKFIKDNNKY